jgi:hypothetical protein
VIEHELQGRYVDTLAAFIDGNDSNDATQGGEFMRRLRPLTKIPGLPTVIVGAHPVKNALEDNLLPFGTGAVINEADGGLTLWKSPSTGIVTLHWQRKLRGPDFEPKTFRFEGVCSPDILDAKGSQFEIPVLRPCDAGTAEAREKSNVDTSRALLAAMLNNPAGTQADWGAAINRTKGVVNGHLQRLKKEGLVAGILNKWPLTKKGIQAINNS